MSLYFPENIQEEGGRPVITFTCLQGGSGGGGTGGSATFPGPVGLQISDSANYGGVELGALGGTALSAFSKSKDKGIIEGVGGKGGTIDQLKSSVGSLQKVGDAATAAASKLGKVGQALGIARGVSRNPNVTTEFTGTNVRSFSFQYKLVPFSAREARSIKSIIDLFRINLYPEGELLYLKYPPKWSISYAVLNGKQPPNLPKFGECYLTSFATTYNGGANAFFEDGNPVEYDINFTFTETKALTRKDILEIG